MAFETYETSQESGSRVEIYELSMGTTTYRMHDSIEDTIVYSGDTYYRTFIERDSVATGQEYLTIRMAGDHPFSAQFSSVAPGQTATLTIRAFHRMDPADVRVVYKGVVRAVAFTRDCSISLLSVMPISEAFVKTIPNRTYQAACNNVLFDANCKVSSGSFSFDGTVSNVSENLITVPGLTASKGDGWATAGYVSFGVLDYRLILEQVGDVLTLSLPFYQSVMLQNVTVFAGCDHTIGTCQLKFADHENFGGCPYVPTKNIFVTGL